VTAEVFSVALTVEVEAAAVSSTFEQAVNDAVIKRLASR
jgi:hypothetical protein